MTLWQPRARRPRRLRRRGPGPVMSPPCREQVIGWLGRAALSAARRIADGRDRRSGAEEVAERAALLRLAGARRARRLVHARRPGPGRRPVPARQGQPHRAREAARLHRPQLRRPTPTAAGSSRTGRSGCTSSSRPRRSSGASTPGSEAMAGQPALSSHTGAAGALSRAPCSTNRAALRRHRHRLRHRSHARHGGRGRGGREPVPGVRTSGRFAELPARFGYRLSPAGRASSSPQLS